MLWRIVMQRAVQSNKSSLCFRTMGKLNDQETKSAERKSHISRDGTPKRSSGSEKPQILSHTIFWTNNISIPVLVLYEMEAGEHPPRIRLVAVQKVIRYSNANLAPNKTIKRNTFHSVWKFPVFSYFPWKLKRVLFPASKWELWAKVQSAAQQNCGLVCLLDQINKNKSNKHLLSLLLAPQSGALRISVYRDFQSQSTYSFRAFKPFYGDQKQCK